MAKTLTSYLRLQYQSKHVNDLDLSDPVDSVIQTILLGFANGTGNDQCDLVWHDQRSLADGASETLDFAGSLTDVFGATVTFAKIKAILVQNTSTTQTMTLGGGASNNWSSWVGAAGHQVLVAPSGFFLLSGPLSGYAVTAGTADQFKIANGAAGSATTYNIWIIGSSA